MRASAWPPEESFNRKNAAGNACDAAFPQHPRSSTARPPDHRPTRAQARQNAPFPRHPKGTRMTAPKSAPERNIISRQEPRRR